MPYDKKSFLAGLAAGRNAESWPANGYNLGTDVFMFTVSAAAGAAIETPWYIFVGFIYWGDGTHEYVSHDPGPSVTEDNLWRYTVRSNHTYSTGGTYQVIMLGTLRYFSSTMAPGYIYPQDNCEDLVSIDTPFPPGMKERTSFSTALAKTPNLVSVCVGLLSKCPNVTSAAAMFRNSGLQTIPEDILLGQRHLTNVSNMFYNIPATQIPPALFADSPNITDASGMFSAYKGSKIPEGLFDPLQKLTTVKNIFMTSSITSIPQTIFAANPSITNFTDAFYMCQSATGNAPVLWDTFPNASGSGCFFACTGLSNYADIPAGWK